MKLIIRDKVCTFQDINDGEFFIKTGFDGRKTLCLKIDSESAAIIVDIVYQTDTGAVLGAQERRLIKVDEEHPVEPCRLVSVEVEKI